MQITDWLRRITGSPTAAALSAVRLAIDNAKGNGELREKAAAGLQVVASLVAEEIAAHGDRPEKPQPAGNQRHHAVIRTCQFASFSDSGDLWRGQLELDGMAPLSYRVKLNTPQWRAFLHAVGGTDADEPGEMISRCVMVELSDFTTASGEQRKVVLRWHPAEAAAAPRAAGAPRTPASRIQGGGGLDDSMFALMPFVAAVAGVLS